MRIRYGAIALTGLLLGGTIPSFAADAPTPRQGCAADYKQFCAGVKPGGGRIAQCMRENVAKLSAPCKEALQAAQAKKATK